jgi:hypothetical protein
MNMLRDFGESFHIKECHLQSTYDSVIGNYDYGDTIDRMLNRIRDFDVYIFHAVLEAESCLNTRAAAFLKLARQSLDHGWMEFNGKTDEKNWKPDESRVPDNHEHCINDLFMLPHAQGEKLIQDQIERYRKAASSLR